MTLYSADFLDVAKPVETIKKKGKKVAQESLETPVVEENADIAPMALKKEKKPATEKQLAALKKAQEARKVKREELEKSKLAETEAAEKMKTLQEEKEKSLIAKKELLKEKRRLKREEKKQGPTPEASSEESVDGMSHAVDEAVAQVAEVADKPKVTKRKRVQDQTEDTPPAWFKKYVAGVKKEEGVISKEKKPSKQIRIEADKTAEIQWADKFTRNRVQNEVDGHMSRMYQMMFGSRRMK